jgi:hypothetical protein
LETRAVIAVPLLISGDESRKGGSEMATFDQKRFASMVRMLQTAYPRDWERHLHNLGVTASADPSPADLDRVMETVFGMVRQAGIKNPADWIAFDMDRVERASALIEPEAPPEVALPAGRQNAVEIEPVKLGTDPAMTSGAPPVASRTALPSVEPEAPLKVALPVAVRQKPVGLAKISGASPVALKTEIKDRAAWIPTATARANADLALVAPEAPLKVALPVAVRQKPAEFEPVELGRDLAKTPSASPLEVETAFVIDKQLSWAKLRIAAGKRREAADFLFDAHDQYGASQQCIAAFLGKSQGWVSCMIRWRRERFKDATPFGPASKDARARRRFGQRLPRGRKLRRRWR